MRSTWLCVHCWADEFSQFILRGTWSSEPHLIDPIRRLWSPSDAHITNSQIKEDRYSSSPSLVHPMSSSPRWRHVERPLTGTDAVKLTLRFVGSDAEQASCWSCSLSLETSVNPSVSDFVLNHEAVKLLSDAPLESSFCRVRASYRGCSTFKPSHWIFLWAAPWTSSQSDHSLRTLSVCLLTSVSCIFSTFSERSTFSKGRRCLMSLKWCWVELLCLLLFSQTSVRYLVPAAMKRCDCSSDSDCAFGPNTARILEATQFSKEVIRHEQTSTSGQRKIRQQRQV